MTVAPVSLTVDHDQPDWGKIQDLLRALAGIVTDQAELARAGKLLARTWKLNADSQIALRGLS
jgi:hypothetical protein